MVVKACALALARSLVWYRCNIAQGSKVGMVGSVLGISLNSLSISFLLCEMGIKAGLIYLRNEGNPTMRPLGQGVGQQGP